MQDMEPVVVKSTRGIFAGGFPAGASSTLILLNILTIASTGNAVDFGDLTIADKDHARHVHHQLVEFIGGAQDMIQWNTS